MYNGLIIEELINSRNVRKKDILDYLNIKTEGGNTALKQVIHGNPTVRRLEPIADFFQVSMDIFFQRKVPFTTISPNVVGNGNAVGSGNTVLTATSHEYQSRIEHLEALLAEKDKRIETLEQLVNLLQASK